MKRSLLLVIAIALFLGGCATAPTPTPTPAITATPTTPSAATAGILATPPPVSASSPAPGSLPYETGEYTAEQGQLAIDIALNDPGVQEALSGSKYHVKEVHDFTYEEEGVSWTGPTVTIALEEAPPAGQSLYVCVDLDKQQVVKIMPLPEREVDPVPPPTSTATPIPAARQWPGEVTLDDVLLRLSTQKQVYKPGEKVQVTAIVENLSDTPITYTMWNQGDPAIYVAVDTRYAGLQWLYEEDMDSHVVLPVVTSGALEAGETIIREVVWDQIVHTYPDPIQAPSGEYTISATFYLGRYSPDKKPEVLEASVAIEIAEAGTLITQEEAKLIALALPEVQEWYKAHSGPNLVKCEDGQYYVWSSTGWEKASPDMAEKVMKDHQPGSNVLFKAGVWVVLLFEKMGPPPHEIYVEVDAHTAQVLSTSPTTSQDNEFPSVPELESQEIAEDYLRNSPTFRFDGIEESLTHVVTNAMRCPSCWEFVFEFQCRHAGYGDRTGQMVAQVVTPHTARIVVNRGQVASAIMDEEWDMMQQRMIEKPDLQG